MLRSTERLCRWPLLIFFLLLSSCTKNMAIQEKPGIMREDPRAHDLRSDLPLPRHSVEAVRESVSAALDSGPQLSGTKLIGPQLSSGRRNFETYCSLCHDRAGTGHGMITLRGFPMAHSLTDPRSPFHTANDLTRVIDTGVGVMPTFHGRISPSDQKAIALYILALRFSHHVPNKWLGDLDRRELSANLKELHR